MRVTVEHAARVNGRYKHISYGSKHAFKVALTGYFYTLSLYDAKGREVFDLQSACEAAEELYGDEWESVFNGELAMAREDWRS